MGRLIDADKAISDYAHYGISHSYDAYDLEDILTECPTVEAIPKDQYENRLKADMVAMLKELQFEIEELKNEPACCQHFVRGIRRSSEIIQQKINELNGEKNADKK